MNGQKDVGSLESLGILLLFTNVKLAHPVDLAAAGTTMVRIIIVAIVVLLVLAALVGAGKLNQKGPHGRGGPLGPPL
jgi:hypothetical protein